MLVLLHSLVIFLMLYAVSEIETALSILKVRRTVFELMSRWPELHPLTAAAESATVINMAQQPPQVVFTHESSFLTHLNVVKLSLGTVKSTIELLKLAASEHLTTTSGTDVGKNEH